MTTSNFQQEVNKKCCDKIKGVYFAKQRNKYISTIRENNKRIAIGAFDDFFEACCARKIAEHRNNYYVNSGFKTNCNSDLKDMLHYNEINGVFTWAVNTINTKAGDIAGRCSPNGYRSIGINGKEYLEHRLAWFYMNNCWPDNIDHINHNRSDNRACNLRNISSSVNRQNISIPVNNKTGVMGVSYLSRDLVYRASINKNNTIYRLGTFNDFFEAVCARKSAERMLNFHENHGVNL